MDGAADLGRDALGVLRAPGYPPRRAPMVRTRIGAAAHVGPSGRTRRVGCPSTGTHASAAPRRSPPSTRRGACSQGYQHPCPAHRDRGAGLCEAAARQAVVRPARGWMSCGRRTFAGFGCRPECRGRRSSFPRRLPSRWMDLRPYCRYSSERNVGVGRALGTGHVLAPVVRFVAHRSPKGVSQP